MAINELKKKTANELKNLNRLCTAKQTLLISLAEYNIRTKTFSVTEKMIEKIKEISMNIAAVSLEIDAINRALDTLDYADRTMLDKFYINRKPNSLNELCKEFHLEIAQIYKLKDKALDHYSIAKNGKSFKKV